MKQFGSVLRLRSQMGEPEDPNIEEITAANAKAFAALRGIAGDMRAVIEHEIMIDDNIVKNIEINPPLKKP